MRTEVGDHPHPTNILNVVVRACPTSALRLWLILLSHLSLTELDCHKTFSVFVIFVADTQMITDTYPHGEANFNDCQWWSRDDPISKKVLEIYFLRSHAIKREYSHLRSCISFHILMHLRKLISIYQIAHNTFKISQMSIYLLPHRSCDWHTKLWSR